MSDPVLSVSDSAEWDRVRAVIAANVYVEHDRRERAQIVTEALLGPRPADPPPIFERDGYEVRCDPKARFPVYVTVDDVYLAPDEARDMAEALVACADWTDNNRSGT